MKPFLLFLVLLILVSRIEKNEATKTLDETHLILPSLQTRPPVKTPTPNPGTEACVNMASKVTQRNFAGRKEVFAHSPTTTYTYPFDGTQLLLSSLKTRTPVKTPTPNPGTDASVNMASTVTERNFVGCKEVAFAPPSPFPSTNAYYLHETRLLLPSLQTSPAVKTPTPNPGTGNSVNMASRIIERNFAGRKEVAFASPPPTYAYPLHENLLLPSLQTRPPVKTPTPNPGTSGSVNMASRVIERNFVGHKEVVFAPPLPSTNAYPRNNVLSDVSIATTKQ